VRTIKLFAVIGLAVALVAVPALAQIRATIEVSGTVSQNFTFVIEADGNPLGEVPLTQGQNAQAVVTRITTTLNLEKVSDTSFRIVAKEIKLGEKGKLQPLPLVVGQATQPINGLTFKVTSVPTLTEWGLIALAVLLAGGMGYMIYRRRPALRPAAP
jgi:hypothetical protein